MAATQTVPQRAHSRNSGHIEKIQVSRGGVIALCGYGIKVRVDGGHLILEDGIADARREARLSRVAHGLKRLVVVGADGMVSLAALRWLADQDVSFVMLERNGSVLATTGPVRPSDVRLRRAQALVNGSETALSIVQALISQKLAGQEQVSREKLQDSSVADRIAHFRQAVPAAQTIHAVALLESRGAAAYWSAWRRVPINFPGKDLHRTPEHWRTYCARESPLTRSPRKAANPANAILNYLYALLEAETRLAIAALGLDPGFGVLHLDAPRDSLACDLMEPVRPQVDAYVLDWIMRTPLKREWFFEQRDGTCRLMASLTEQLSQTSPVWGRAVAPFAEWFARSLWSTIAKPARERPPATRLTQRRKREAKGAPPLPLAKPALNPDTICRVCGAQIRKGKSYCVCCAVAVATDRLKDVAREGRVVAASPEVQARRSETQRGHAVARWGWTASSQPDWLTNEFYETRIQPLLANVPRSAIVSALGVSKPYASEVRSRKRRPHPRHWLMLAKLVGITEQ